MPTLLPVHRSLPFQNLFMPPFVTPTGRQLCRKKLTLCRSTEHGNLSRGRAMGTSSLENGFFDTKCVRMAHWRDTRHAGLFVDLPSGRASTSRRLLVPLSNRRRSVLCSPLLRRAHGQSTSSMSKNVKNAFLHGFIDEEVFCLQPAGFVDQDHPDHVCRLGRSLYGLKQAPRAWF